MVGRRSNRYSLHYKEKSLVREHNSQILDRCVHAYENKLNFPSEEMLDSFQLSRSVEVSS